MIENPVTQAATISGAIIAVVNTGVAMASGLGWVQWDTPTQALVNGFAVAVVNLGALVLPMLWARKRVTPLIAPKDEDGEPLVRARDKGPTIAAVRAALK